MSERYEIRKGKNAPCELWSCVTKVSALSGSERDFWNFVCDGTHNYCASVKLKLEVLKDE